nr:hypothetical protein [Tanacetum cinerariifolium]
MSDSEDSAVTYTSVYTDSEPGRRYLREAFLELSYTDTMDFLFSPFLRTRTSPLPPIDSPTTESHGYVAESDPEEDPKYEDDEEQDGPVDYPMGEGDDGGDDDGDSSGDDAADEDEDIDEEEEDEEEEEEEEEEHIASADSTAIIPVASVSLPSMVDVERLLALPTPPLSPLTSLSPPFAGERLARLTDPSALTDAVTAALPSSSVDCRDEIPESERPPRKRSCLFTIGSRYKAGESSTTRPTRGQRTDYGLVSTVDFEARRQGIRDVRVVELAELHEHDIQDFHALLEDAQDVWTVKEEAYAARVAWNHSIGLSQATYQELQTYYNLVDPSCRQGHEAGDERYAERVDISARAVEERERARTRRGQTPPPTNPNNMTPEAIQTMIDQALLRNSGSEDGSHNSHAENPKNMHTALPCYYADFMKCHPLNFKGTEGAIKTLGPDAYTMTWSGLKKKMTDKYCPLGEVKKLEIELWNLKVRDNNIPAYTNRFQELALIYTKFKLRTYAERKSDSKRKADDISKNNQQPFKRQNVAKAYNLGSAEKKTYEGNAPKCTKCQRNHPGRCTLKCHRCGKIRQYARDYWSTSNTNATNNRGGNGPNPRGNGCFECENLGHFKRDCPKLNNKNKGNGNAQGWVYDVGNAERNGNVVGNPDSNAVTGTFLLNNRYASILFDSYVDRSFVSTAFSSLIDIIPTPLDKHYDVELADGKIVGINTIIRGCTLNFLNHPFTIDLMPVELGSFNAIIGMDWLRRHHAVIVCDEKVVQVPFGNETLVFHGAESYIRRESRLTVISYSKVQEYRVKGCHVFLAQISASKEEDKPEGKQVKDIPIVQDFPEVFLENLPGLPPARSIEF